MPILLLITAVLTAPPIRIDDESGCVDRAALTAELADLPAGPEVELDVSESGADVRVDLRLRGPDGMLLKRGLDLVRADCSSAAALVARIVRRRLDELPRHRWQYRPPDPSPPPSAAAGGLAVSLDLDVGFAAARADGEAELWATVGARAGLRFGLATLDLGALVGTSNNVTVGSGEARLIHVGGLAGGSIEVDAGRWRVAPRLGLVGGVRIGQGLTFRDPHTEVMPLLEATSAVTVYTPWRLYVSVGLAVPLLVAPLRDATDGEDIERNGPVLRLTLAVGVRLFGP